jgi:hypothetical protein
MAIGEALAGDWARPGAQDRRWASTVLTGMRYEPPHRCSANLLRWIVHIFRRYEISGGSVGATKLVPEQDIAPRV